MSRSALRDTGSTRHWRKIRERILRRDGYICQYCGQEADTVVNTGGTAGGTTGGATTPTFGTTQETELYKFLQTPNLSDKQIAAEVNRLGLKADQISKMTGVPVDLVNSRLNLVSTQTAADTKAAADAKALADAQAALAAANSRASALAAAEAARVAGLKTTGNQANFATFSNWLNSTPGLTNTQIAAEMNRLGINAGQVAGLTGIPESEVQNRFNAVAPFSNATQGFAQNFNNYQSIPIGAQYNPDHTKALIKEINENYPYLKLTTKNG